MRFLGGAAYLTLWTLTILCGVSIRGVVKDMIESQKLAQGRRHKWLPVGSLMPAINLTDLQTGVASPVAVPERTILFLSAGLPLAQAAWMTEHIYKKTKNLAVVCSGDLDRCVDLSSRIWAALPNLSVLADPDQNASDALGIRHTPVSVDVDATGRVGGYAKGYLFDL